MRLNIFRSTTKDGMISEEKEYFPNLTKEEIKMLYQEKLKKVLKKYDISAEKAVFYKNTGEIKAKTITNKQKEYKEKILLLKEKEIPVIVETDDYPIIVGSVTGEKELAAIGLGTIENINQNIIHEMIEVLMKKTGKAPFEMIFYIGPCPNKDNLIKNNQMNLSNKRIWEKAIINEKYIDLRFAIMNLLFLEIVDPNNVYFDSKNPVEDKNFYSSIANRKGKNINVVIYTNDSE